MHTRSSFRLSTDLSSGLFELESKKKGPLGRSYTFTCQTAGLIEPEDEAAETICKVARICFVCFAAELLNFKQAVEILPHPKKKKKKKICPSEELENALIY